MTRQQRGFTRPSVVRGGRIRKPDGDRASATRTNVQERGCFKPRAGSNPNDGFAATGTMALWFNNAVRSLWAKGVSPSFAFDWSAALTAPVSEELAKRAEEDSNLH